MKDPIIQLAPNFYGIGIDIRALADRLRARIDRNPTAVIATRFIQLFELHNLSPAHIPRVLQSVRYSDLASDDTLLAAMTPELIDLAASTFGVRPEWLSGIDDGIYSTNYCYKSPRRFFEKLDSFNWHSRDVPVRAVANRRKLDRGLAQTQRVELIMVEHLMGIGETEVVRYHTFSDGWDWCYPICRSQIKAMVRSLGFPVPLYEVTSDEVENLYAGTIFPATIMRGALLTEPSLEDYAMTKNENAAAKEIEELPEVENYMRDHRIERRPR